jgi:hypothetical protein
MAISTTQSSQVEFADWLRVLAKPVVAERFSHKIKATPRMEKNRPLSLCSLQSSSLVRNVFSKYALLKVLETSNDCPAKENFLKADYSRGCVIELRSLICTAWVHSGRL